MNNIIEIPIKDIIFREDLYPRIKHDPKIIQKYCDSIEQLPPIEINQHNILIDGYHRLTAYRKLELDNIKAIVIETESDNHILQLSIERNAKHGLQLSNDDKKKLVKQLYIVNAGNTTEERSEYKSYLSNLFSVSIKTISRWVENIDKEYKEERNKQIFDLYLSCHTQDEIAEKIGIPIGTLKTVDIEWLNLDNCPKSTKLSANFEDEKYEPPLYNIWSFSKKSNEVNHFGNSEQRIVENLLYLYTQPFDIVIDPFAGGGSTKDICLERLRRYYVSDLTPIVERENEIRQLNIIDELPDLYKRWSEVSLVYLDPPYWRQAAGKYSDKLEDLANMDLDEFHMTVTDIINRFTEKLKCGSVIAMLMSPTQWPSDNREFNDHTFEITKNVSKKLKLTNRVSCPYSTEQYNGNQVKIAKEEKLLLALTRELTIWQKV